MSSVKSNRGSIDGVDLRLAVESDSRFFWTLANDPVVREVSFNSRSIPWETHEKWFSQRLNDPCSIMLVADRCHKPIGVIRFERKSNGCFVSVSMVPSARGKGYGQYLVELGSNMLFEMLEDVNEIFAQIKEHNFASIRVFEKAGYLKIGNASIDEEDDALVMELKRCRQ